MVRRHIAVGDHRSTAQRVVQLSSHDLNSAVQVAVQGAAAGDESVKASGINGFWISLLIFCVIAAVLVARVLIDLFITQRFMLAWRAWLTDRLTGDWLDGRAYYRDQFIDDTIDNPTNGSRPISTCSPQSRAPNPTLRTRQATARCCSVRSRRSCR